MTVSGTTYPFVGTEESRRSGAHSRQRATRWPDLRGVWACAERLRGTARLPALGRLDTESRVFSRVVVRQDGHELDLSWHVLALELDTGTRLTRPHVTAADIAKLPATHRGAILERGATGVRLVAPEFTHELRLPLRFEGLLSGRETIIQRTTSRFVSDTVSARHIAGTIAWSADQEVVETNNPLLRLAPRVTPRVGPNQSIFKMMRVGMVASVATERILDMARSALESAD